MKKLIILSLLHLNLLSLCLAQDIDSSVNEESDTTIQRFVDQETLQDLDFAQHRIEVLIHQRDSLLDTISQLKTQVVQLKSEIGKKNDTIKIINNLDEIIYRQCLIYPLNRRYDPLLISDAQQCLETMKTNQSHSAEFDTYHNFLAEYEGFNNEVTSFLNKCKEHLAKKENEREGIDPDFISNQKGRLEKTAYCEYYKHRNEAPWKSILYLDEVIDDFLKQLNSRQLTTSSLQELIDRLKPKQRTQTNDEP